MGWIVMTARRGVSQIPAQPMGTVAVVWFFISLAVKRHAPCVCVEVVKVCGKFWRIFVTVR